MIRGLLSLLNHLKGEYRPVILSSGGNTGLSLLTLDN